MPTLTCDFTIGDRVNIDGCSDLTATITAVQWRTQSGVSYELGWVCGGKAECVLIEGWRLTAAPRK